MLPDMGEVFVYELLVRESHLDTFGHVNNAKYLELFEEARWEIIAARGFGLERIQAEQVGPVILKAEVSFRRELKNREPIRIETQLEEYRGLVGRLRQTIYKQDGTLCCSGILSIAMWDMKTRKLLKPTAEFLHSFGVTVDESVDESSTAPSD